MWWNACPARTRRLRCIHDGLKNWSRKKSEDFENVLLTLCKSDFKPEQITGFTTERKQTLKSSLNVLLGTNQKCQHLKLYLWDSRILCMSGIQRTTHGQELGHWNDWWVGLGMTLSMSTARNGWDATNSLRKAKELCPGLQKFLLEDHLLPKRWKQTPNFTGQHSTSWANPHRPSLVVETDSDFTSSPSCADTPIQLQQFNDLQSRPPHLSTWLWKLKQRGKHFMTVTFLPNDKVSHVKVLAVDEEWIPSCGQRQFLYSCNMMMQNLKNRKPATFFRGHRQGWEQCKQTFVLPASN